MFEKQSINILILKITYIPTMPNILLCCNIYSITGIADRLLHMLTEERDDKVLNAVTVSILNLSKTHAKQIVQNMIHYKLQNSVIIIFF